MKTSDTIMKKLNQKEKVNSVKPIIEQKKRIMLLKKGSKGDDVKELQKYLLDYGWFKKKRRYF